MIVLMMLKMYSTFIIISFKIQAYKLAGKPQDSIKMLLQLTSCATTEHRFQDASYYYWLLSSEHLRFITAASPNNMTEKDREYLAKYRQYLKLADLFYSYHVIYRFVDEPFLFSHPETIFNSAQFILNNLGSSIDTPCISRMHVLLALAKQAQVIISCIFLLTVRSWERINWLERLMKNWVNYDFLLLFVIQLSLVA